MNQKLEELREREEELESELLKTRYKIDQIEASGSHNKNAKKNYGDIIGLLLVGISVFVAFALVTIG